LPGVTVDKRNEHSVRRQVAKSVDGVGGKAGLGLFAIRDNW
jgi:hypothetical protein